MAIYIFTLLACLFMAMLAYQKTYIDGRGRYKSSINERYKSIIILFAALFLMTVGLRSYTVGNDTLNYKHTFLSITSQGVSALAGKKWYDEIGYTISIILFGKLGLGWQAYAFFMAALYIVPVMHLILKKTNNAFWGFVIFILAGLWTYPMSTMRQAAAMGIVLIAFFNREKPVRCALLLLVAFSFHVSALIALLYLIALRIPLHKKNAATWGVVGVCVVILATGPLRTAFFAIMEFFGRTYVYDSAVGGTMMELFFCATVVIGYIYAGDFSSLDYVEGLKAIFLAAVILPIVRINPTLFRAYFYFSVYQIVFIPQILARIKDRITKAAGYTGYTIAYLYLFFTQVMVKSLRVVPYRFFWENEL